MNCENCNRITAEDEKFCANCGTSLHLSSGNSDIFKALRIGSTRLEEIDLPSPQEKETWQKEMFIGKEGSQFYADFPAEYDYNYDIRLSGTNSFIIEDQNYPKFRFSVVGEEISQFFQNSEDLSEFRSQINLYLDKIISSFKKAGVEISERDFRLEGIETGNSWWCRAVLSYNMNSKIYWKASGYNMFGKALVKVLGGGKNLEKAGYGKGKDYKEYKIIDFFYPKPGFKHPFFALVYAFDNVSGGDERKRMRALNGISDSLGYDDSSRRY